MKVTLKNGEVKEFDSPLSVYEIAASLSAGLAKKACAAEIDGTPADLRTVVASDCALTILTFDDEGGRAAFHHTTSHILAQAVKRLFPETKLAIVPSITDGFYYDFDRPEPFSPEDLEAL